MLSARIVVVFSEFGNADSLVDSMLSALASAARPYGIRFALPLGMEYAKELLPADVIGGVAVGSNIFFYPEAQGLEGTRLALRGDETHFLSVKEAHVFENHWDSGFLKRLHQVRGTKPAILTAMVSAEEEGLPPQAFLPALAEEFSEDAVKITRGLPLVCAARPVRSTLIHPSLLFGEVDFLKQAETESGILSIGAFVAGYHVYVVEKPLLWPKQRPRARWLLWPHQDRLPAVHLARFEQSAGFSFEKRRVGVRASLGLFFSEEGYLQAMPLLFTLEQQWKALAARAARPMPMFVTAFYELPEALKPALLYMIRFSYLQGVKRLPLLLYAGGRQERLLRMNYPNTFSYPDNALLPKSLLREGMTATQHFKRNKILLLQRSMAAYPAFAHYAWVDFDILPYPIPPQVMPDFSPLTDETIHLAVVDGEPDGSFLVIPRRHMKLLTREVQALSQVDAAIKRSFSEGAMLKRLIEKFPDLFTLHPMPERQLLFFTGFDARLLSERTKALLRDLPPVIQQKLPNKEEKRGISL